MLLGLGKKLCNASDFESLCSIASTGNLSNVDLTVGDISKSDIEMLTSEITAANFANIKDSATDGDLALGLINVVLQTILLLASFACRDSATKRVILTGSLTELQWLRPMLDVFALISPAEFIIPKDAAYATAVGAALHYKDM